MRTHGAIDEKLEQVRAQHVPVVIVILFAVLARHDQTADAAVGEQCFVHREIGEVFFDCEAFLQIERLTGLELVECSRWIRGVTRKRVRR